MHSSFFISDLHLSEERPATVDLFLGFLKTQAPAAQRLYILGDLFDAWVGDDDDSELSRQVISALRSLSHDCDIFIMHGNRDFLIGEQFSLESRATLLPDPSIILLGDTPVLITHGDQLCTQDKNYQKARKMRSDPKWISDFLAKPLDERKQFAEMYRQQSGEAKSLLADDIMDVTEAEVVNWFEKFNVSFMIHGHTHRPATHEYEIDGRECQRIVLPEWHETKALALAVDDDMELTGIPVP
jgi:UDP-2,3-diacylglucosamine hydrolase